MTALRVNYPKPIMAKLLNSKSPAWEMMLSQHAMWHSWCFTVLVEAYDKLGHQGVNRTYHLIKHQYYLKGMNKDIHKYINNCALCKGEKARTQVYPLLMTDIPDRPYDKIAIDLVSDPIVSASGKINTY